jgi:threonine dehydrogenase-like Zn-dependent dehydrogenase
MEAVVVRRGEREPRVVERPRPTPAPGEALVRVLRVGVDGTDREVIRGAHGGFPAGADELVLGHEAVGVVADANDTALREGTVVVPPVRTPAAGGDPSWFERGEPDMAPWDDGDFHERGIAGADGYMAEYVACPAEALVSVPAAQAATGFLVEPLSIAVKALEHATAARSAFDWRPESALVLGNGSLGLLTLGLLDADDRFDRLYCLGRRDRPDPTVEVIEEVGATYVDSRETPVAAVPDDFEAMDLVFEATGYPRHAVETVEALAPGGVGALLGVPEDWETTVDAGRLHREMVLDNKALVGSVNSNRSHLEAASERLAALPGWLVDRVVTGVYPTDRLDAAFADDDTTIKTAVELGEYEKR